MQDSGKTRFRKREDGEEERELFSRRKHFLAFPVAPWQLLSAPSSLLLVIYRFRELTLLCAPRELQASVTLSYMRHEKPGALLTVTDLWEIRSSAGVYHPPCNHWDWRAESLSERQPENDSVMSKPPSNPLLHPHPPSDREGWRDHRAGSTTDCKIYSHTWHMGTCSVARGLWLFKNKDRYLNRWPSRWRKKYFSYIINLCLLFSHPKKWMDSYLFQGSYFPPYEEAALVSESLSYT